MVIVLLGCIWLAFALLAVVVCRVAAEGDRQLKGRRRAECPAAGRTHRRRSSVQTRAAARI